MRNAMKMYFCESCVVCNCFFMSVNFFCIWWGHTSRLYYSRLPITLEPSTEFKKSSSYQDEENSRK